MESQEKASIHPLEGVLSGPFLSRVKIAML
jgi:hypothetical protein